MSTTRRNKIREESARRPPRGFVIPGQYVVSDSTRIAGQRVVIAIFRDLTDAPDTWRVAFLVGATRQAKKTVRTSAEWKQEEYGDKSTGRSGLAALLWAAKKVDEFQTRVPEATVAVGGADDRRLRVYKRLVTRGFLEGNYAGEPVMFRTPAMFTAYKAAIRRNTRRRSPTATGGQRTSRVR
jgi:hypothetical protein